MGTTYLLDISLLYLLKQLLLNLLKFNRSPHNDTQFPPWRIIYFSPKKTVKNKINTRVQQSQEDVRCNYKNKLVYFISLYIFEDNSLLWKRMNKMKAKPIRKM